MCFIFLVCLCWGLVWGEEVLERWALVFGMYFIFWFVVCYALFVEIEGGLGWSGGVLLFGVVKVMFWVFLVCLCWGVWFRVRVKCVLFVGLSRCRRGGG